MKKKALPFGSAFFRKNSIFFVCFLFLTQQGQNNDILVIKMMFYIGLFCYPQEHKATNM